MPGLIWFEWAKCPDGYTVEAFREEYAEYSDYRILNDPLKGVARNAPILVDTDNHPALVGIP